MNWGEFKATIESMGMTDDDELSEIYLDLDGSKLVVTKNAGGTKSITEESPFSEEDDDFEDDDEEYYDDDDDEDEDEDDDWDDDDD